MGAFSLTLPYPPTVNHYWRAVRDPRGGLRFAICEAGQKFRREAGKHVMLARTQAIADGIQLPLRGPLFLNAFVYPPDARKRDLDNILKPLLDCLQYTGVILDDADVGTLLVKRCRRYTGGKVHVMVTESL